ncbi:MAG: AMP-binding protein [Chloroflexota bacterium]
MQDVVTLSGMAEALLGPRAELRVVTDRPLDLAPDLGTEFSGRVLGELLLKTTRQLLASGLRPGDEVAVVKSNHFDIGIIAAAVVRIGGFAVLLSGEIAPADVQAMLHRLSSPLLITDRRTLKLGSLAGLPLRQLARRVIVLDGESAADRLPPEAGGEDPPVVVLDPSARIMGTHSSGTTGIPKIVIQSTSSLAGHVRPQVQIMRLLRLRGRPYAVHLAYAHVRTMVLLLGALTVGIPLVCITRTAAKGQASMLVKERPFAWETYPNVFTLWEELADSAGKPMSSVRFFFSSFDAMHPRTCRRILAASGRFMPMMIVSLGLSELGPVVFKIFTPLVARHSDSRCVGWRIPNPKISIRIADREGAAEIPRSGVNGRLQARTAGKMVTYFGEDQRAQDASDGDWFFTGDIAQRTRWGCYHIMDREPEFDAAFGSGLQVEDALLERLPELNEVVVIHRPGALATPVYSTYTDQPIPARAWEAATLDLPAMAEPIRRTWATFPRTATSKVRRPLLRQQLEALGAGAVAAGADPPN